MTFVDDNLLGTGPIRSAKSGAKAAGKFGDLSLADQRSAFETAFADAGKKKQPVVSIGAKPLAETALKAQKIPDTGIADLKVEAKILPKDGATEVLDANVDGVDNAEPLFSWAGDLKTQISAGDPADAAPSADVKSIDIKSTDVRSAADKPKSNGLLSVSLAQLGKEATADAKTPMDAKTVEPGAADKIADLLNAHKAQGAKHSDPKVDKAEVQVSSDADIATDTAATDVSQLLSLLDTAQTPAIATAIARPEATPAMSEFQALAERAGKAKSAPKDGQTAKTGAGAEGDRTAVKNATQAGSDQVFRFARADGKVQTVSMNVKTDGDKSDAPVTNAKAETVTVLEARRYLGLAPTGNAATVTNQIASNPEWAKALQSPAATAEAPLTQAATGKVLNTLKIQMHPIDLGTVTATLRLKDDELHVELKVETGDAFRQLSDDQNAMVKALRAQGFAVDQVSIVFNAPDSSGGNAQQQAQSQTGQQGRETAGDGQAQSRGQGNENGARGQSRERLTGNDGTSAAHPASELDGAGDVYM